MAAGMNALSDLEQYMKGLANENRLALLSKLRRPVSPDEVRLTPSIQDGQGTMRRPIARQAVRRHVETLKQLGVVVELEEEGSKAPRCMVDIARLYLVLEDLRLHVASVQADSQEEGLEQETDGSGALAPPTSFLPQNGSSRTLRLPEVDTEPPGMREGPHFELVRGLGEGDVYLLNELAQGKEDLLSWTIGRLPESDVHLEYDPYVAPVHARVLCRDGDFFLEDVPGNTNGTNHNWSRFGEGEQVRLRDKDVVGVGRSLLLFRE